MGISDGFGEPAAVEAAVRSQLADSLAHVAARLGSHLTIERGRLEAALTHIRERRQDPGVFARYFDLVLAVTEGDFARADRLTTEIVELSEQAVSFSIQPYDRLVLGVDFERFPRLLFSEFSNENPMATPAKAHFADCRSKLLEAIKIIRDVDPKIHDEVLGLLVRIYVAAASANARRFGGVTSLMIWGATFINADAHRTTADMVHFLVHEITHALLFGVSCGDPLVLNSPAESYPAPLRTDRRPMDGIYHATLVCARLAEFDRAWLDSDRMTRAANESVKRSADDFVERFRRGVSVIDEHGKLSERARILLDRSRHALSIQA
jgi:HEXXH motif-containing protein